MNFLLQDALGALETPGGRVKPGAAAETPLTDVINRNLQVALANSSRSHGADAQAASASPQLAKATDKEVRPHRLRTPPTVTCDIRSVLRRSRNKMVVRWRAWWSVWGRS